MRRLIAIIVAAVVVIALVVIVSSSGDSNPYQVRAIFRNAFSVIPGEDVKIAGVKVGSIGALDTHAQGHLAAVVLNIEEPGFQDFRTDATCTIRPQSLIGEKFVECTPTQVRPVGTPPAPELPVIRQGPGKGQHYLPLSNTTTPVDLDQVNNITRLPYSQRLTVILNELGIGLGARGTEIQAAIREANPALKNLDRVIAILADQNKVLARLAEDSDQSLTPLAAVKRQLADYFTQQNTVNEATAEEGPAFEKNLQLFPPFLRQLTPTMRQLQNFADQATPVFDQLYQAAPSVNTLFATLPAFARASTPAFQSLGTAADAGKAALDNPQSLALSKDLKALGAATNPASLDLADLLTSLQKSGGISRLMDFIYFGSSAINGYDAFGHYLRTELLVNLCTEYATVSDPICNANFAKANGAVSAVKTPRRRVIASSATATQSAVSAELPANIQAAVLRALPTMKPASVHPSRSKAATGRRTGSSPSADPSGALLSYLLGDG